MSECEATVRRTADAAVVDLRGEIDAAAERPLSDAYDEATRDGARAIVLNFGAVDYMNSTGIALIVGLLARARKEHRHLSAYGVSDHYREIFEVTRLSDYMRIASSEDAAVVEPSAERQEGKAR